MYKKLLSLLIIFAFALSSAHADEAVTALPPKHVKPVDLSKRKKQWGGIAIAAAVTAVAIAILVIVAKDHNHKHKHHHHHD